MIKSKAQSSWEYLIIVALILGVIVPTAYLIFRFSSESNEQILDTQINEIGKDIIDTAESVYFSGKGSRMVLEVYMPENVLDVYIRANRELVFKTTTDLGEVERVFFSSPGIKITSDDFYDTVPDCTDDGNCKLPELASPGLHKINIQSIEDGNIVLIGEYNPTATTIPGATTTTTTTTTTTSSSTTTTTTTTSTTTTCECSSGVCCDGCNYRPSSYECRASAGPCDAAEYCTGSSEDCPSDSYAADGTDCGTCVTCNAGVCNDYSIYTAGTIDSTNPGLCNALHYRCDGAGGCTAPIATGGVCLKCGDYSDGDCTTMCLEAGYMGCESLKGPCDSCGGWCCTGTYSCALDGCSTIWGGCPIVNYLVCICQTGYVYDP